MKSIELSADLEKFAEAIHKNDIINRPRAKKMKLEFANRILNLLENARRN